MRKHNLRVVGNETGADSTQGIKRAHGEKRLETRLRYLISYPGGGSLVTDLVGVYRLTKAHPEAQVTVTMSH